MFGFSQKLTSKGTWRQVFICLSPLPSYPMTPYYPHLQYTYSHRDGGGGGRVADQGEGYRSNAPQAGRKYQHD
jgi:hypothetical protein